MSPHPHLAPVRAGFHAVVRAVAPASAELDDAGWARLDAIVEDALAARSPAVRRQLRLFLRVLSGLALLRHGRTLARLGSDDARRLLAALHRSRLLLLRRGVWGLRTLAFMGYYGQPHVRRAVGYRAAPGGWEDRGATAGPWPGRKGDAPPEAGVLLARGGEGGGADGPRDAGHPHG